MYVTLFSMINVTSVDKIDVFNLPIYFLVG